MIPADFCIFNIKIPNKKLHFSSSVVISAKFEAFQFHIFRLFFKMKNLKLDLLYGSPPNFATKFKGINKLSVPPEIIKKTYDFLMISEDNEVN